MKRTLALFVKNSSALPIDIEAAYRIMIELQNREIIRVYKTEMNNGTIVRAEFDLEKFKDVCAVKKQSCEDWEEE